MAYDPRAIKLPKSVKRLAANELDPHKRGALIRSYVKILEADMHSKKRSPKDKTQK
jgi:hypothetical protein